MLFLSLVLVITWMRSMIITWISFDIIRISTAAGGDACMTVVSSNNNNKAFENTAFIWLSLSKPWSHELRSCHLSVSNYIELQFGLILTSCHDWHLIYALIFGDLSLLWQQKDKYVITLFHLCQSFNGVSRECKPPSVKNVIFGSCPTLLSVRQLRWWSKRYMPAADVM